MMIKRRRRIYFLFSFADVRRSKKYTSEKMFEIVTPYRRFHIYSYHLVAQSGTWWGEIEADMATGFV